MARVTFDIPNKLMAELKEQVPWGLKRHLVIAVLQIIIKAAREDGNLVLGAILDGQYKLVRDETTQAD